MKIVIMAGGRGNRLWPKSASGRPKQFLALTSEETMLQVAYRGLASYLPIQKIYIATAAQYRELVLEQLPELSEENVIVEPAQRDTGPCIALAAMKFINQQDDEVMVTLPSDHLIPDMKALVDHLLLAEQYADSTDAIVTLGIVPTRAETNYGYMRTQGTATDPADSNAIQKVNAFMEKPNAQVAQQWLQTPGVYWNSGIFIWKPSTIAYAMNLYQPDIWQPLLEAGAEWEAVYPSLPKISVDYAILEKYNHIYCIPANFHWDDVGTWQSLDRFALADEAGNIVKGNAILANAKNNIIVLDRQQAIILGVSDLIIISTEDGLLVCHKSNEALLKPYVQHLETTEGGAQ